jgi:hypothetical protein
MSNFRKAERTRRFEAVKGRKLVPCAAGSPARAAGKVREASSFDHAYEPGAYGVCRRCGEEKHTGPG